MIRRILEWVGWLRIGRDIDEFVRLAEARRHKSAEDLLQVAKRALESRDRGRAYEVWREALDTDRSLVRRSNLGLHILFGLGKIDEAAALVEEGSKQEPQSAFFCEAAALIALRRNDQGEAVRHYAILRKRFPRYGKGYRDAVPPLIALGRLDEADRLMRYIAEHSRDPSLWIEYARLAMTRRDWAEAMRRWNKTPTHEFAILGRAECLRELGQFDDAERILRESLKTPRLTSLACWIELAHIAEARADWSDAARQWAELRLRAPTRYEGYQNGVAALRKCGRDEDAEAVIREAERVLPKEAVTRLRQVGLDVGAAST